MLCLKRLSLLQHSVCQKLCESYSPVVTQMANVMKVVDPPDYKHVEYPSRRRLRVFEKVPHIQGNLRQQKMRKMLYLMRGPELVNNTILYGDYGIQALQGGRMRHGHYEGCRLKIARNIDETRMFAIWRVGQTWQTVTKKGVGHRMGGGKGSISRYEFPIKANRMIVELGGELEFEEAKPILKLIAAGLPFKCRIVSRKRLEDEEKKTARLAKRNRNPFTFEYCFKHNFLGINIHSSPYDNLWYGKYR